jgi:hypothetical protein
MINSHMKKYSTETHVMMSSTFSSTTTPQLFQVKYQLSAKNNNYWIISNYYEENDGFLQLTTGKLAQTK